MEVNVAKTAESVEACNTSEGDSDIEDSQLSKLVEKEEKEKKGKEESLEEIPKGEGKKIAKSKKKAVKKAGLGLPVKKLKTAGKSKDKKTEGGKGAAIQNKLLEIFSIVQEL